MRRSPREYRPLTTPRRRILWRRITTYTAWYRSKAGDKVVIHSVTFPPSTRTLRGSGGLRKYKRVKYTSSNRKVLIVAKSTKKKTKKTADEITDDELEELEGLEDLEDVDEDEVDEPEDEDEDEDEDEEDEDEDDEDEEEEEEPPKKSKKSKASSKKKTSRSKRTDNKVGSQELADHLGITPRDLRMLLRKLKIDKDPETSRYEWSSFNAPEVKKIVKAHKSGATKAAKQEGLEKLKASKETSSATKKKSSGTKKSSKKKKAA